MIKELHLVARVGYSVLLSLIFSQISEFSISSTLLGCGLVMFITSFIFQYYVLYFALKKIVDTPRGRTIFLIIWGVVSIAGMIVATFMLPTLSELSRYESASAFMHELAKWGAVFDSFGGAFIASACTRRAFTEHESLG